MYDVVVLGGGPAGYNAAQSLSENKKTVALIEQADIGGTCLNHGCIPYKTFLKSSKLYSEAKYGSNRGIVSNATTYDQSKVVSLKNQYVSTLRKNIESMLDTGRVVIYRGKGEIRGITQNRLIEVIVNEEVIECQYLIICTGSSNKSTPINFSPFKMPVMTNVEILNLEEIPANLLIIGAGVAGLEMADYFASIGSRVTVIEKQKRIEVGLDEDIALRLQRSLMRKGAKFHFDSQIIEVGTDYIVYDKSGDTFKVEPDIVLVATGRMPNIEEIGIQSIGIEYNELGICTDLMCRTTIPNVFACGDVNGNSTFAHTAIQESFVAVNNILGNRNEMDYGIIPTIIYTSPECAIVGESEKSCEIKGIPYCVHGLPLSFSGRYFIENAQDQSYCKLIFDSKTGILLGCQMLGNNVSEIILSLEIALINKMNLHQMKQIVYPHPTVGEIIGEIVRSIEL